jgi:lipopolysaccharide exporter
MAAGSNMFSEAESAAGRTAVKRASGSFFSHVVTLASGAGVSQGINVLGTLVLARLIAPNEFGLFALFVTVVTLVSVIGGARYELAIMLPEQDSEAANVAVLSAMVVAAIAIASIPFVAIFGHEIAKLLGDSAVAQWLWTIPPVLLLTGLGEIGRNWFGRTKDFRLVATARIGQSVGLIGGQLGLWAVGVGGGIALIGGWLIGQCVWTGGLLGYLTMRDGRFIWSEFRLSSIPGLAAKYKAFPIYRTPYSFIANGTSQLIFVIFRLFCGLNVVGIYLMANRAVYFPVALFGTSMGQVFYQKAATEIKSTRLEPFVNQLMRSQIALSAPVLIFFAFEAPLVFDALLGARWKTAGTFAAWLAFAGILYLVNNWLARLYDVCGHQRLALVLQLSAGATSLGALTLALYFGHGAIWGIAAFTISEVICSSVWVICAFVIAGFQLSSLLRLTKDFAYAAAPLLVFGLAVHRILSAWPALAAMSVATLASVWILWKSYGKNAFGSQSTVEKFRRYWSHKARPLHLSDSPELCRASAAEIRSLFPTREMGQILEIGCGDGSAFPYLEVPVDSYKGVDFSQRFLDTFRARYPRADLTCAEGSSYVETERRFDVIFSNEVIQHFDPGMLDRHLRNARRMMRPKSVLILGSVADGPNRRSFEAEGYVATTGGQIHRYVRRLKAAIRGAVGIDYRGFWYTPDEIVAVAKRNGFRVQVVRSELRPYRFHAVLFPDPPAVPDPESARATGASQPSLRSRRIDDRLPA